MQPRPTEWGAIFRNSASKNKKKKRKKKEGDRLEYTGN